MLESSPPRPLTIGVALVAGAMLLLELVATRIFSVLFFYHYSFFAVSLVMSGLAFGGILAGRWDARGMARERFEALLWLLSLVFSLGILVALASVLLFEPRRVADEPEIGGVVLLSLLFLPCLVASGAFLALAFARRESWVARLYAADLAAASGACIGAILLMRSAQGPGALLVPAAFAALAGALFETPSPRRRQVSGALALLCVGALVADMATGDEAFRLRTRENVLYERWNEHSRVIVRFDSGKLDLVIDKVAGAGIPRIGPPVAGLPPVKDWWDKSVTGIAYRLGRPLDRVAIIGVGGSTCCRPSPTGPGRSTDTS